MTRMIRRVGVLLGVAALLTLVQTAVAQPAAAQPGAERVPAAPVAADCRLIDFDSATVRWDPKAAAPELVVSGWKPWLSMSVSLQPLYYIQQPDYYGIQVVGCMSGVGLPAVAPYTVTLSLAGITGTLGIEVIGATRSQKIPLSKVGRG